MNLPNKITVARLIVSLFVFVLIPFRQFGWAMGFFLLAACTDWLDGYIARKYKLVTQLGRIMDPFADKILITGTFIFLAAESESRIAAWMAVLVVGRELLVTVIRSFLEQQGVDFSANMAGKLKMVFQCAAVALSLLLLSRIKASDGSEEAFPTALALATSAVVWLSVASTIYSGVGYVISAAKILRTPTPAT